jgi:hypothetical protein
LHDRTADKIARLISRVPNATATIIPYDTQAKLAAVERNRVSPLPDPGPIPVSVNAIDDKVLASRPGGTTRSAILKYGRPKPPDGALPMCDLVSGDACDVQGRVRTVQVAALGGSPTFTCEIVDETGIVTVQFYGRRNVAGIAPGRMLRVQGRSLRAGGGYVIANPDYQLLSGGPHD